MTQSERGRVGSGSAPAPPAPDEEDAATARPEEDAAGDEGRTRGVDHAGGGFAEAGRQRWPLAPRGHDEGGGGAGRRASPAAPRAGDEDRAAHAPGQATATREPDRRAQDAQPERAPGMHPPRDGAEHSGHEGGDDRLVAGERANEYQRRFTSLKGEFVDDPRRAVREVDRLVGEMLEELERGFRGRRATLSERLSDEHAGTEELRHAFADYGAFLDRLLAL
jgi:hypothetical protein